MPQTLYANRGILDPSVDTVYPDSQVETITLGAAVTCTLGDLLGDDGSQWIQADADARIPARYVAMATQATAGGAVQVCRAGVLYRVTAPFTARSKYYLSTAPGVATCYTTTLPVASTTLTLLQRVGIALSTTRLAFDLALAGPDLLRANVTYDPASLTAVTARSDTVALTGLLTTDIIRGVPEAAFTGVGWNSGLIIQAMRVVSSGNIEFRLQNPTAGSLDGASVTIEVMVERF